MNFAPAYGAARKAGAKFTSAFCWAHARRKFLDAEKSFPREAGAILNLIDELFRIDRRAGRDPPCDIDPLETIAAMRERNSRPSIAALKCWMEELRVLPSSSLGRALGYMDQLWTGLIRFLEDPAIPLSNNSTERGLRGLVVGRKNFYGCKSRRGMEVAALFYTLFESAKLVGIEPKAYLKTATAAALDGDEVPLPHEVAAKA